MTQFNLAPSLLSANFYNLEEDITELENNKIEYLHLDVMDGLFVPNISFGIPVIKALRNKTKMIFDTHLMIINPIRYIEQFHKAGSDIITIHYEACNIENYETEECIKKIKQLGMKIGLSIKPKTEVKQIYKYLEFIDLVLVMSVEPGFGGQEFIKESLYKIEELNKIKKEKKLNYLIEVDGGINAKNIQRTVEKGCNIVVAGSSVFNGNITNNINILRGEKL